MCRMETLHLTLLLPLSPEYGVISSPPIHKHTPQFCLSLCFCLVPFSPLLCLSLSHTHTHTSCPMSNSDGLWQLRTWWHSRQPPSTRRGKSLWNKYYTHTSLRKLLTRSHLTLTLLSAESERYNKEEKVGKEDTAHPSVCLSMCEHVCEYKWSGQSSVATFSFYIQAGWRNHVPCQLGSICTTHRHAHTHTHKFAQLSLLGHCINLHSSWKA